MVEKYPWEGNEARETIVEIGPERGEVAEYDSQLERHRGKETKRLGIILDESR